MKCMRMSRQSGIHNIRYMRLRYLPPAVPAYVVLCGCDMGKASGLCLACTTRRNGDMLVHWVSAMRFSRGVYYFVKWASDSWLAGQGKLLSGRTKYNLWLISVVPTACFFLMTVGLAFPIRIPDFGLPDRKSVV